MNRERLDKALRVDGGGWAEGFVCTGMGYSYIHQLTAPERGSMTPRLLVYKVKPETVCQYTGLKDSHGVKIFEGDKISFTYWWFDGNECESQLAGTIVYSGDLMSFQLKGVKNEEWEKFTGYENDQDYLTPFSELNFEEADFEITGNIHDEVIKNEVADSVTDGE